jgi:hypothetical protein
MTPCDNTLVAGVEKNMKTHSAVQWLESVDQAEIAARDTQKLVLIDLFNPN